MTLLKLIPIFSILEKPLLFDGWEVLTDFEGPSKITPLIVNDDNSSPIEAVAVIFSGEVKFYSYLPFLGVFKEWSKFILYT